MPKRNAIIPIILPPCAVRELERWARDEDRDAIQQARWILKRALAEHADLRFARPRSPGDAEPDAADPLEGDHA